MAINPDLLYDKTREQLIQYEDAHFAALMASIPDCYTSQSDSTLWGSILRILAEELARLEYDYAYDIVGINPAYLTPPDLKRRWAAPLQINKSYPESSQFDLDYKALIVALLAAYPEGCTLDAIGKVITAYTGETVVVQELYKLIGNGLYDDSDRNTIKVSLNTTSVQPLSQLASANLLQTLAQNLYSAIDLAKPAHIGLDYSLTFGTAENMATLIASWTDKLKIVFHGVEPAPLPPIFTLAPMEDPTSPDTRLTAYGKQVASYLTSPITAAQYAALMSDAFRAEYIVNPDGTYSINPTSANDVVILDASGNPTGEVSTAVGVLAPQLERVWTMKSDTVKIYRLT
jgi:hypothetical protein